MARRQTGEESAYREAKRAELLKVCAELIARRGFAATTVREIGDAAGLLSGSLYYYFSSKEDILESLVSGLQDVLWARYQAIIDSADSPRVKLERALRVSLETMHTHNDEVRVYQNEGALLHLNDRFKPMAARRHEFEAMISGFLVAGVEAGEFRSDLRVHVAFRLIRDSVWPIVHWYRPGGDVTIEEVAEEYLALLFDGLAARSM